MGAIGIFEGWRWQLYNVIRCKQIRFSLLY